MRTTTTRSSRGCRATWWTPCWPEAVAAVYDFCNEMLATRKVSDATLGAAKAILGGDRGVVDLVGTMGLYQITAMMVTLDQTPLGAGVTPFFP